MHLAANLACAVMSQPEFESQTDACHVAATALTEKLSSLCRACQSNTLVTSKIQFTASS